MVTAISACATFSDETEEAPDIPDLWNARTEFTDGAPDGWLSDFGSPQLNELVDIALTENFDIQSAKLKIDAARARAAITGAIRYPQAEIGVKATETHRNSNTLIGSDSRTLNYSLEGAITWEVDLWGRLSNRTKAAKAEYKATEADYRGARLLMASEVAKSWFRLLEARRQLKLSEEGVDTYKRSLNVIESRYRSGVASALDVRLARTDLAIAESSLATSRMAHDTADRSIQLLLGRYPAHTELAVGVELPAVIVKIPGGMPSEMVNRRPDLNAARLRLLASGERLNDAKKNLLPSIRLTVSGGTVSEEFRELLNWDNLIWNLIGGITEPLFSGGRLRAEEALARVTHKEAWVLYAKQVQKAFYDVEISLSQDRYSHDNQMALTKAADEATEAAKQALSRYRLGLTDVITLLSTQQRMFSAKSALLRATRARLDNRVNLYMALGGNFYQQKRNDE